MLQDLKSFVPPDCFDVHAHLYRGCDSLDALPKCLKDAEGNVGFSAWRGSLSKWMGARAPAAGLFFAFPKPGIDIAAANRFVRDQLQPQAGSRALLLIQPGDDPAGVFRTVSAEAFAGFKVYHVYANRADTFQAEPAEFLPDWAWEIAHQRGLVIMLHMVRDRALADEVNQRYIRDRCMRYPNAKVILAHAARGFCAAHTVEGIASLRGIENVFFDTSAVCESPAIEAILREFGPSRLMFGTDFPVSELSGRCVSLGDGFLWLDEKCGAIYETGWANAKLVGVESLLAIQQACRAARMTDADVGGIFGGNARKLLGIGDSRNRGHNPEKTERAYQRAKEIIPGGTQLLSKRPENYAPGRWPAYAVEARGCWIRDMDGREYCDMTTSGIGSCLLGYADPDVTRAVVRRVEMGSMCSLNATEELELAELLVELHLWAQQVRFCRSGGESMAVAVRLARASTRREAIAFCGYHGWSDWYLAANLPREANGATGDALAGHLLPGLSPVGVPSALAGTALPFAYNRLDELRRIVADCGSQLAAVVMEPFRYTEPEAGFLEEVREICDKTGAVLVFDEITTGWRFGLGGIHREFGVEPDIVVYAKAIGNGHPIGAVLGRSRVMDAAQSSFVSSTYWTEAVGPAAAIATIAKLRRVDVSAHVGRIGGLFRDGLARLGRQHGVPVRLAGRDALLHLTFEHSETEALTTLLTVRMLDHGILATSGFYPSLAHEERHVERYMTAADQVFGELSEAIRAGDVRERIKGRVRHSGFARLT